MEESAEIKIVKPELINPSFYDQIVFSFENVEAEVEDIENVEDIIVKVDFTVKGEYSNTVITHSNSIYYAVDLIDTDNIIPIENITLDILKNWITEKAPLTEIYHSIAVQINSCIKQNQKKKICFSS